MSVPDSVRLAMPAEAVDIARLQRRAWSRNAATAPVVKQIGAEEMARSWHEAIVKPPLAHFRVLVAIGGGQIVGFTVVGPSPDSDATVDVGHVAEFVVDKDPDQAHSGRLINAAVDTLRKDGYESATMWVPTGADDLRAFLIECGWDTDGAHQELGTEDETARIRLVRLHTDIRADEPT